MSSYFTAGSGTEREKSWKHEGKQPRSGGCGRERDGTGTKPDSVTAGRNNTDKTETETVICRVGSERSPCPVLMRFWRQEADVRVGM